MEVDSREFERLGYLHPRIQRHSIGEVQPELALATHGMSKTTAKCAPCLLFMGFSAERERYNSAVPLVLTLDCTALPQSLIPVMRMFCQHLFAFEGQSG